MELNIEIDGDDYIITLAGDINLYNATNLKDVFRKAEEEDIVNFVVDLGGVRYIDSSGLGALIFGAGLAKRMDAGFYCRNLNEDLEYLFRSVNLDRMLGAAK